MNTYNENTKYWNIRCILWLPMLAFIFEKNLTAWEEYTARH